MRGFLNRDPDPSYKKPSNYGLLIGLGIGVVLYSYNGDMAQVLICMFAGLFIGKVIERKDTRK